MALTIVAGPASALGLVWLRREETLASKRHKDAVTRERYAGRTPGEVMTGEVKGGHMNGHAKANGTMNGRVKVANGGLNGHVKTS